MHIWVAVQPLPDVLAAIQSCYTNTGECGRNTSLTSNIVGYEQKHVLRYEIFLDNYVAMRCYTVIEYVHVFE